ncbi:MAG: hypothetical protein A2172_03395 [Candidatus Woykebacteria bacterium RBG_13_40_15]|uniref:Uncharacterized protein n=1 Tax=Candidatus Woykebacteria bacterium RBG_13_40_15 TaxID=1802593 RepID=A0A1G1W5I8_9BACT|nr:MAG: hypothetical protein A2172_03395 [Candidatus Woykebacteria bacterium RBG_13_40_15]
MVYLPRKEESEGEKMKIRKPENLTEAIIFGVGFIFFYAFTVTGVEVLMERRAESKGRSKAKQRRGWLAITLPIALIKGAWKLARFLLGEGRRKLRERGKSL